MTPVAPLAPAFTGGLRRDHTGPRKEHTMATTYADASALEVKLKQIIADHPETTVHPHSPSGPYVRAVMWTAHAGLLKGQVFWDPDTNQWVVRAMALYDVLSAPTVVHPASEADIPAAITQVIAAVNDDLS